MPIVMDNTLNQIRSSAMGGGPRTEKAKHLADGIRKLGNYRWVGIYDVGAEEVSILAWSGAGAPEFPKFPVSKGLTGAAIEQEKPVIVGDVRNDPRYITAFGNTLSEIIVPVLSPTGTVIGTVDAESDRANAFTSRDADMIQQFIAAALPLWLIR
ncbi:MAG TPA: GAF domain-containing protein [Candidatus Aquilonibacter sp.]|nr:GAF domain-containing protein [Candidatus Aquilonibacter sp.]